MQTNGQIFMLTSIKNETWYIDNYSTCTFGIARSHNGYHYDSIHWL